MKPASMIQLYLNRLYSISVFLGVDLQKTIANLRGYPKYLHNLRKLRTSILTNELEPIPGSVRCFGKPYPIVDEFYAPAGNASGHYFHQDLLVANYIYNDKPSLHLDIGSRIDGFIAHLLAFEQQTVLGDIRPVLINNPNISFVRMDLMGHVDSALLGSYESISCLHAIEHMGLGRYGDPVNAYGHYQALKNLCHLLSKSGIMYLSFPIGKESRIEYNAHRVVSLAESRAMFRSTGLVVRNFAYVDDAGNLFVIDDLGEIDWQSSYNLTYGCGIWTLTKDGAT
jgi:hypothetical protein